MAKQIDLTVELLRSVIQFYQTGVHRVSSRLLPHQTELGTEIISWIHLMLMTRV